MTTDLKKIVNEIAKEFKVLAQMVMDEVGVNDKVGRNTLVDSNLYKSVGVEIEEDGSNVVMYLLMNDYVDYVEHGMPPKYSTKFLFSGKVIEALRRWLIRKNICPSNEALQMAYAVRQNIYNDGIKGRPIIETIAQQTEDEFNGWTEKIYEVMLKETYEWFKKKQG